MKVVILAGGFGTRLAEETEVKPKPMVEIGGKPILWHIMKHYSHYGFHEFYVALGYRGDIIKRYFLEYARLNSDCTVQLRSGDVMRRSFCEEDWTIHLIDTGLGTMTGGRIKRLESHIGQETFLMTYGDGVSSVNLPELLDFHRHHGKLATVTAVRPPARFGELVFNGHDVARFSEKSQTSEGWINGGYFVLEPRVFGYIDGDETPWEREPVERLAKDGQLTAYRHEGFWQCMDTLRDQRQLESLWNEQKAPWKLWN